MCIGSLRYNIGLKCKYAKILLTTKMIQHSKSMQKTRINAISNKKKLMLSISTTLSGVISQAKSFLLPSCGTLGSCLQNPWVPRNPG